LPKLVDNIPNGKDNATCKEWNTIAEEIIQKQEKTAWKSESAATSKATKTFYE
jgi:DNA repair protein RadA/Sms